MSFVLVLQDLRLALEEHQSALELIMSKYREQVVKLVVANRLDRSSHAAVAEDPEVSVAQPVSSFCPSIHSFFLFSGSCQRNFSFSFVHHQSSGTETVSPFSKRKNHCSLLALLLYGPHHSWDNECLFCCAQVVREKIDKISEMAAVMQKAIQADDDAVAREQEVIEQLKLEVNKV